MRSLALAVFAALSSTLVFALVLGAGGSPHVATLLRLAIATPILYLAMARTHAPLRAAFALGAATGAKLMIEPLVVTLLGDRAAVALVPLAGDLGYGALLAYVMVRSGAARPLAAT